MKKLLIGIILTTSASVSAKFETFSKSEIRSMIDEERVSLLENMSCSLKVLGSIYDQGDVRHFEKYRFQIRPNISVGDAESPDDCYFEAIELAESLKYEIDYNYIITAHGLIFEKSVRFDTYMQLAVEWKFSKVVKDENAAWYDKIGLTGKGNDEKEVGWKGQITKYTHDNSPTSMKIGNQRVTKDGMKWNTELHSDFTYLNRRELYLPKVFIIE